MVLFERWRRARAGAPRFETVDAIPLVVALWIGIFQCASLWPGTSRSMVTILGGLIFGCSAVAAAEFSFLLALPTLGAATLFDFVKHRDALLHGHEVGGVAIVTGLVVAAVVAAIAIRSFLRYLTRHGLTVFGAYRILLGVALLVILGRHAAGFP